MDSERAGGPPPRTAGVGTPGQPESSLDRRLQQAQKLELLGHFASGIAHDLGDLAGILESACDQLAREDNRMPAADRQIEVIRRAAHRAEELASRLQAFARPRGVVLTALDLNELVSRHLPTLRGLLPGRVSLDVHLTLDPLPVRADEAELAQALANLVANACDALPLGGTVTISTASQRVDGAYVSAHPWAREGDFATVTISDNGRGMAPTVLARAFEPFFTTKEPGHGTGLGLSLVFASVKRQDGMIEIASRPDAGTTVKLLLPRASHPGRSSGETPAVSPGLARETAETILVAEDAPELRHMVVRILKALGYRVLEAADGDEALELLLAGTQHVDLVLADVVMPRMGGVELFQRARAHSPQLAFLLTSGYAEEDIGSAIPRQPRVGAIPKPYRLDVLACRIRELLDERA
ncbi:MAG: ATP-binding protein [Thermoanaerobaculaceae bacterium]